MKAIKQALIFALMFDAAIVATGLAMHLSMWIWIVVYWIILTLKNAADFIAKEDK